MPASLDNSPWQWVDRPEQLAGVADAARQAGRVALDVEHHSRRSYLGITCLLQLSTGALFLELVLTCAAPGWFAEACPSWQARRTS
jgi:hypothetical protein